MIALSPIRFLSLSIRACGLSLGLWLAVAGLANAEAPPDSSRVLDRIVAVVNNQAILESDVDLEIRLSVLDASRGGTGALTPAHALDQLISRELVQQQIGQENAQAAEISDEKVKSVTGDLRSELPACVHEKCASDAGWAAYLAAHGLTVARVDAYIRYREQMLVFIEQRFRQGIRVTPAEIEAYYHSTLLPQYAAGAQPPPLDKVSHRIQEILLEQQVNAMFDEWLRNLRKQGDVEILDPALEIPETSGGGAQAGGGAAK